MPFTNYYRSGGGGVGVERRGQHLFRWSQTITLTILSD